MRDLFIFFRISVFFCLTVVYSAAVCPEISGVRSFGKDCHLRCRCKHNAQCEFHTGKCPDGCEAGMMGPGCQYENMAFKKTSIQRSTVAVDAMTLDANMAVDGAVETCTRTQRDVNNWWRVDLGTKRAVVGLRIYPGTETPNNRSFVIYVMNVTDESEERHICYKDTFDNDVITEPICYTPLIGQYVEIRVAERAQQQLCEVQIYGGKESNDATMGIVHAGMGKSTDKFVSLQGPGAAVDGSTVDNDVLKCSQTRRSRDPVWSVDLDRVYSINSVLIHNREDANVQDLLEVFRLEIDHSPAFDTSTLHTYIHQGTTRQRLIRITFQTPIFGQYVRIKLPGDNRILTFCEVEIFGNCLDGHCGFDCQYTCLCNTSITGLRKINNTCPYVCSGRTTRTSNKCEHACDTDHWGAGCLERCGRCLNNTLCDVNTGVCPGGCLVGFQQTPRCNNGCEPGLFGQDCNQTCGHCANNGPCIGMFGTCQQCEPGYQFPLCKTSCKPYTWGVNCNMTCGKCRNNEPCNLVTGYCPTGCGFRIQDTARCDKGCEPGFYGSECRICGKCEGTSTCDPVTGHCEACQAGYQLPYCRQECLPGRYGVSCFGTCGHCKDGEPCNHVTGICKHGCKTDWIGDHCNIGKHMRSLFGPPGHDHGTIAVVGAVLGGLGSFVCLTAMLIGLAIYCSRRYKKRRKEDMKYKSYMIRHQLGIANQPALFYDNQTTF